MLCWQILRQIFIISHGDSSSSDNGSSISKVEGDPVRARIITDANENSESSESNKLLFNKISKRKWALRLLAAIGALQVLIPVHIILTTRLGNNFQWMFPANVALWFLNYFVIIIIIFIIINVTIIGVQEQSALVGMITMIIIPLTLLTLIPILLYGEMPPLHGLGILLTTSGMCLSWLLAKM